jgi:hypothetical protein
MKVGHLLFGLACIALGTAHVCEGVSDDPEPTKKVEPKPAPKTIDGEKVEDPPAAEKPAAEPEKPSAEKKKAEPSKT